ncbi:MAG: diguanylate cyclase [Oscillospiraceae bacterium]|nr:diguanylate cyclase [Oscillospiraceae bacterium]
MKRAWMSFATAILYFLTIGAFIIDYHISSSLYIKQNTYNMLRDSSAAQITAIRSVLKSYEDILSVFSHTLSDISFSDEVQLVSKMKAVADANYFEYLGIANATGEAIDSNGEILEIKSKDFYVKTMAGETCFIKNEKSKFLISVPVYNQEIPKGVLFAVLSANVVSDLLILEFQQHKAYSFICDSSGAVISEPENNNYTPFCSNVIDFVGNVKCEGITPEKLSSDLKNNNSGAFYYGDSGNKGYVTYMPAQLNDWYIFCITSADIVEEQQKLETTRVIVLMLKILIITAVVFLLIIILDRKRKKQLESEKEHLRQSEERYELMERLSESVTFEGSFDSDIIKYNQYYSKMYGRNGTPCTRLSQLTQPSDKIFPEDMDVYICLGKKILEGISHSSAEYRILDANGTPIWQKTEYLIIKDADGKPLKVIGKITNIDQQQKRIIKLRDCSERDSMTELINHGSFKEKINASLSADCAETINAFIYFDIDKFKSINDTLGHTQGDRAIVLFSDSMKKTFRETDYLGRLGGDEFGAFLKNISSRAQAKKKVSELYEELNKSCLCGKFDIPISFSMGIALYPENGNDFDSLYISADKALYEAKHLKATGKNNNCPQFL